MLRQESCYYRSYFNLRCLACEEDIIEDWRHIRECSGLKEPWMNVYREMVDYMDTLLQKILSLKKDPPSPDIIKCVIFKILGSHPNFLTFLNFKRYEQRVY